MRQTTIVERLKAVAAANGRGQVIVAVAPNGGCKTKADHPALPLSADIPRGCWDLWTLRRWMDHWMDRSGKARSQIAAEIRPPVAPCRAGQGDRSPKSLLANRV
jgi:hypothetical protein